MQTETTRKIQIAVTPPVLPAYLRRREAAALLSISLGTLDSFIKRGVLSVIRPSPGVVLLRRSDLDQALDRFRIYATGEKSETGSKEVK